MKITNYELRITKKVWFILLGVVLLSAVLRLWQLGAVPLSPDWDEAALGYNAYSLLHTGRDEYGKFLPVVLQSFNDYKPALYSYLVIPFIAIFDLSVFAVRLPSALFGIATVFATFFLVRELCKRNDVALLSAFFLAISPWHIQFSRVAFESNVGLALNVFAVLCFLKGLKRPWLFVPSVILADLSLYVYQSEKVFTPLLFFALVLIYHKQLFSLPKKYLITAVVIGLVILFPMVQFILTNKGGLARAKGVSIFSQSSVYLDRSSRDNLYNHQYHNIVGFLFDNHWVVFARETLGDYLLHFNLNWLFLTGDIARHHAPGMGVLYLWELPFILIGIYQLLFGKYTKQTKLCILAWFLIAPIPSAVSIGAPHAVRTLNFLPMYQIFTALGVLWFIKRVASSKYEVASIQLKYIVFIFAFGIGLFNIFYYLNQYFVQQNYFNAKDWQYGYAQTIAEVEKMQPSYQHIVVSSQSPLDQSYIFFLFYLKYPPQKYQIENANKPTDTDQAFSNFVFRPIDWKTDQQQKNTLYIGSEQDFPKGITTVKTINYPDGEHAMLLVNGSL